MPTGLVGRRPADGRGDRADRAPVCPLELDLTRRLLGGGGEPGDRLRRRRRGGGGEHDPAGPRRERLGRPGLQGEPVQRPPDVGAVRPALVERDREGVGAHAQRRGRDGEVQVAADAVVEGQRRGGRLDQVPDHLLAVDVDQRRVVDVGVADQVPPGGEHRGRHLEGGPEEVGAHVRGGAGGADRQLGDRDPAGVEGGGLGAAAQPATAEAAASAGPPAVVVPGPGPRPGVLRGPRVGVVGEVAPGGARVDQRARVGRECGGRSRR